MGYVRRFSAGERPGASRFNQLVDEVNGLTSARAGAVPRSQDFGLRQQRVQIKAITFGGAPTPEGSFLTCVLIGEQANPDAREWIVFLPQVYWEPFRGAVSYTYSDVNTRLATDGGTNPDETQLLTPPLTVGETVWCGEDRDTNGVIYVMLADSRMWGVDPT